MYMSFVEITFYWSKVALIFIILAASRCLRVLTTLLWWAWFIVFSTNPGAQATQARRVARSERPDF